ncbi:MAG TPA: cell division topological specificity factor MinE [Alphaproteobacteria bacterium]|nr:cell division topological specificity factor MinE [Alphaproteobacteria bacterium]
MSLLDFFRASKRAKPSAEMARDRLQIVLAHERISRDGDDFLPRLEKEIMAVVARYVEVENDRAIVKLDRSDDVSTLEIEIELPTKAREENKPDRMRASG